MAFLTRCANELRFCSLLFTDQQHLFAQHTHTHIMIKRIKGIASPFIHAPLCTPDRKLACLLHAIHYSICEIS